MGDKRNKQNDITSISRRAFFRNTAAGAGLIAITGSTLFQQEESIAQTASGPDRLNSSETPVQTVGGEITRSVSPDLTIADKGVWVVKESMALRSLTIAEGASLSAPNDKSLTMTVYGIGTAIQPGSYRGDIFLTVSDKLMLPGSGLMRKGKPREYRAAIFIEDGKYVPEKSIPAIVRNGKVTDNSAVGVSIYGCEESFNGIIIIGNSTYTIDGVKIDFEGMGHQDFIGEGAGLYCGGNAKVTVNNSSIKLHSVTRCAVHACGHSVTTFNNCRISNDSPATDYMFPTWVDSFTGSNRVAQHCDYATTYYNNCHISGNGWGALSHDGGLHVRMYVKDSTIELTGPRARGYGAYSIGDCFVSYDHVTCNVQGYPLAISGTEGKCDAEIKGGSVINSTLYGVKIFDVVGSELKVKKSTFNTASSVFVVKGSNATINIDDAVMKPANGVILQLMDNDLPSSSIYKFIPPVGKVDVAIPGRDLTVANQKEDVFMTVANTEVAGDFYNSTTNLKANCNENAPKIDGDNIPGMPKEIFSYALPDVPEVPDLPPWKDRQGPRNLGLRFSNTKVKGVISAATASYKEGVMFIDPSNCQELSAVKQTASEPVNNGVIVSFDKNCIWTVAGISYLTSLTIDNGAVIKAPNGKILTMTVDGVKTKVAPGIYKGKIVMEVV